MNHLVINKKDYFLHSCYTYFKGQKEIIISSKLFATLTSEDGQATT